MKSTIIHRMLFIVRIVLIISLGVDANAAIGIYNWTASAPSDGPLMRIEYRLNCEGSVTIQILDQNDNPIDNLGPFNETAGLYSHDWNGNGSSQSATKYRAKIIATNNNSGTPGTMTYLFGNNKLSSIYGLAIDKFVDSPGYGTIYVSKVCAGGKILAYNADGTVKSEFGSGQVPGELNLGFYSVPSSAPWGIGVDRLGNIYVACSVASTTNTGIKVFDYRGIEQYHVFIAEKQGIFWLDGLANSQQELEVYETCSAKLGQSAKLRASTIDNPAWNTIIDFGTTGVSPKQICFEPNGSTFYIATYGSTGDAGNPNPGVARYTRQADSVWAKDSGFNCGLETSSQTGFPQAYYVTGVSCDARDPDADGPYTSTSLWMALNCAGSTFGANIFRKTLPNGEMTPFQIVLSKARFTAADAVGNVAIDCGYGSSDPLWTGWAMYAPSGEYSTDTHLTNWIPATATASREVLNCISEIKARDDECLVELRESKRISAVFSNCFYIEESGHLSGLKANYVTSLAEGTFVRIGGKLDTECGERVLKDVVILDP